MRVVPKSASSRLVIAVAAATFFVYAVTAARTITFWEGALYPLLARTMSIANPPGSLLLTLIGRILGDVPFAQPAAFRLNLIAALIGATTTAVLMRMCAGVMRRDGRPAATVLVGSALAAFTWAFGVTPWTYATQFTPYGLSALFTALILGAFMHWWRTADDSDAAGDASVVGLLLGLDVSVHRANLVLLPAIVLGVLLRRPRALVRPRFLAAIASAFAVGASLQLLYIPISRREPFLDTAAPSSLIALWHYIRLDLVGGHFLMDVWPRHADIVRVQFGDLARFLGRNFGAGVSGWLAIALIVAGLVAAARRSWRLAITLLGFVLAAGLGVIAYLNRPASYFRALDRHYLPFLATLMPLLAVGVSASVDWLRTRAGRPAALVAILLAALLPLAKAITNFRACNLSRTQFAETFARDLLQPLPPHALLLTNGDNDSFPLWYLQQVEGVRRDVTVVNLPVARTVPGAQRVRRSDPALASFVPSDTLVADLARRCIGHRPVCIAVTVPAPPIAGITERLRLTGLAWRVAAWGDTSSVDRRALERFVHDRLPRAGFSDSRKELDNDLSQLAMNYVTAALQLGAAQQAQGDWRGLLKTIEIIERSYPASRRPPQSDALKDMLGRARQQAEEMMHGGEGQR